MSYQNGVQQTDRKNVVYQTDRKYRILQFPNRSNPVKMPPESTPLAGCGFLDFVERVNSPESHHPCAHVVVVAVASWLVGQKTFTLAGNVQNGKPSIRRGSCISWLWTSLSCCTFRGLDAAAHFVVWMQWNESIVCLWLVLWFRKVERSG